MCPSHARPKFGTEFGQILKNAHIHRETRECRNRELGVKTIERKTKIVLSAAVLALAVLSGIALMTYANGATNNTNTTTNTSWNYNDQNYNGTMPFPETRGQFGRGCGGFGLGQVTVSQEFKDNVISIVKNDSDVQQLLTDGYNITNVRPIISTTVQGDGTVTTKATTAIVTLIKDTTGRATVWVDTEQAKVTRIEILTRTIIDKS